MVSSIQMRKDKILDEAKSWCLKNDIKIYAVPINNSTLKIEVDYKGSITLGKEIFQSKGGKAKDSKWWLKAEKLYLHYYTRLKEKNTDK
jgi:hypothetical protein